MVVYKARTTFMGADGRSEFFFSTKEKAEEFISKQINGEVRRMIVPCLPYEGCTWDDIMYNVREIPHKVKRRK